jgi:DNA-binding GntR family transcriptional regulator
LEAEGYVTGDSYRGACVAPFDESASEEVLELRLLLEARLIRRTAEKVTAHDITELQALAAEFEQAFNIGDRAAARGINYRFHRRLFEAFRNSLCLDLQGAPPLSSSTIRRIL